MIFFISPRRYAGLQPVCDTGITPFLEACLLSYQMRQDVSFCMHDRPPEIKAILKIHFDIFHPKHTMVVLKRAISNICLNGWIRKKKSEFYA